jgi:hypothetical protein
VKEKSEEENCCFGGHEFFTAKGNVKCGLLRNKMS